MNTNNIKRFAQQARLKLIEQVGAKLEYVLHTDSAELREKTEQVRKLREAINRTSKEQVIEKVAYTWFNRLMALRFMDANDYEPIGVKVLTPKEGYTLPEILDEAKQGHISDELPVNKQHIFDLLDGKIPSNNAQNEAYKELLIGACNHLNTIFPFLFERINDYAELLIPDDLTSEFSIVHDVVEGMTDEDCQEVELIGWLYQFYISEKKDEVFASNSKVKKEDIPAATQLFTPRWIVEYMVQNTVGKLWLQNNPNSGLREHMPYFIESPSVESEDYLKINSVEEITLLDQACGSGHILVYGFELFAKIYEEEGYNSSEIAQLIIEKNLFGFEIDQRAAQLAGLALMMKARSYQRRVFRKAIKPNILCFEDLGLTTEETSETFAQLGIGLSDELSHDLGNMQQATNLGSLIQPKTPKEELIKVAEVLFSKHDTSDAFLAYNVERLGIAIKELLLLADKYHCVVDNPPYMSDGSMNVSLSTFVKSNYPASKGDLMACFMEAGLHSLNKNGFLGMINQHSWMFLGSYEKLRKKLIKEVTVDSLLHLGPRTFPEIGGEVVQNAAFVFINNKSDDLGVYIRLVGGNTSEKKKNSCLEAIDSNIHDIKYFRNQKDFSLIPGIPYAYWLGESIVSLFKSDNIGMHSKSKAGIVSGNDALLLRFWHEVKGSDVSYQEELYIENSTIKYVPINKGGALRKYYGNQEHILDISKLWDGKSTNKSVRRGDPNFYFKEAINWSYISNTKFGFRISENVVFGTQSPCVFTEDQTITNYLLGFLNSKIVEILLPAINPTVSLVTSNIECLPLVFSSNELTRINDIVNHQIDISKEEWNSRETSWDFQQNELVKVYGGIVDSGRPVDSETHQSPPTTHQSPSTIEETYDLYKAYWSKEFFQLHKNEEELNRQFIDIYGLQDELTPDVPLEDITILKEETKIEKGQLVFQADEVFEQFISYAVGCMFGRYSLDKEGLILANQGETLEDYWKKVLDQAEVELDKDGLPKTYTLKPNTFIPDNDNIIPVLNDEWFEDDITGRFYAFLKASFGEENFEKNLAFVEESLGKDIRKYFVKDFYKDHIKRYKKRPIYWMFSSPKGSFNVLIYMHRYTPDTLNQILNGYLIEYREKLKTYMEHLDHLIETGSSSEQTKSAKEKDKLKVVLLELQEYERDILYPLATERISIDLDDGVLVNYNKFGKAIKTVAGLNDAKAKKKVRGFDWIDVEEIRD